MNNLFCIIILLIGFSQISYSQEVSVEKKIEQQILLNRKNGDSDFKNLTVIYTTVVNGIDFDTKKETSIITQVNNLPEFRKSSITRYGDYHQIITYTDGNVSPEEFKRIITKQQIEVIDFTYSISL